MSHNNRSEELEQQCRVVADQLIARYEWRLLERDQLAQRAYEQLPTGATDRLAGIVIGVYCVALHTACSGAEGALRQNQAYAELACYLYDLTCMRFTDLRPETCEDVIQSTLERIFRAFGNCREPVAFLSFAAQHLLDAVRVARRQERRPVQSFEQELGASREQFVTSLPDPRPEPIEQLIAGEQRTAIERLLQEFARDHPRAMQQASILRMSWLDDLDDAAISRQLEISLSSVYTARSRIIKTLQSEPKWRARAGALGILLDEL